MNHHPPKKRRWALITGTTSGIGKALADQFAQKGHALVLVCRDAQRLDRQKRAIESRFDVPVFTIACDLSDPWVPEEIMEALGKHSMEIEILVNNAGFNECGYFAETNLGREIQMIQTHVTATTSLTKRLLPAMIKSGAGKILNVGSTGSLVPCPKDAVYCATKAYVLSFSEALSAEFNGSGITVTALLPGATRPPLASNVGIDDGNRFTCGAMDTHRVATIGYRALMKGKRRVIAGTHNQMMLAVVRFMPAIIKDWMAHTIWCKFARV